jgi:hypothetical protein
MSCSGITSPTCFGSTARERSSGEVIPNQLNINKQFNSERSLREEENGVEKGKKG